MLWICYGPRVLGAQSISGRAVLLVSVRKGWRDFFYLPPFVPQSNSLLVVMRFIYDNVSPVPSQYTRLLRDLSTLFPPRSSVLTLPADFSLGTWMDTVLMAVNCAAGLIEGRLCE